MKITFGWWTLNRTGVTSLLVKEHKKQKQYNIVIPAVPLFLGQIVH